MLEYIFSVFLFCKNYFSDKCKLIKCGLDNFYEDIIRVNLVIKKLKCELSSHLSFL